MLTPAEKRELSMLVSSGWSAQSLTLLVVLKRFAAPRMSIGAAADMIAHLYPQVAAIEPANSLFSNEADSRRS